MVNCSRRKLDPGLAVRRAGRWLFGVAEAELHLSVDDAHRALDSTTAIRGGSPGAKDPLAVLRSPAFVALGKLAAARNFLRRCENRPEMVALRGGLAPRPP